MAVVTKFVAQMPRGKVSLIVVPVASKGVEEAAEAWSEVLRVRVAEVIVYGEDDVELVPRDLAEKLEVRPAVLGLIGPAVHVYRRDSGVCVSEGGAYREILEGDMDVDEWLAKADSGAFEY
ncbi:hypothetical protein GGF31_004910 [Allomyces arbusculus]|nr:hypothetical protein GGF31_004910 [Allomyces arbusculus]